MPFPGEVFDGYRIIRLIGSGGFGEVWLCQSEAVGDLRALKFIHASDIGRMEKEFDAICRYRTAAGLLRSPSILPIEHVNRRQDGLFYVMPLADGYGATDPHDPEWHPLTLAAIVERRKREPTWLGADEIKTCIAPVLHALQLLSDSSLVHRDVKPENILFLDGTPCLGDIGLLGADSHNVTRRGTPGYSAPSWFVESGGHPDMYGAATTLYSLLTGNPPDKMGRAAFKWPPQGERSLSAEQKQEWVRLHKIIRRATDDRPAERFRDFAQFATAVENVRDGVLPKISKNKIAIYAASALAVAIAGLVVVSQVNTHSPGNPLVAVDPAPIAGPPLDTSKDMATLDRASAEMAGSVSRAADLVGNKIARVGEVQQQAEFSAAVDSVAQRLEAVVGQPRPPLEEVLTQVKGAKEEFLALLQSELAQKVRPDRDFRAGQMKKVMPLAMKIRNDCAAQFAREAVVSAGRSFGEGTTGTEEAEAERAKTRLAYYSAAAAEKEELEKLQPLRNAAKTIEESAWEIYQAAQQFAF